ncbi:hypothetical protein [Kitasatospora purpeofusca]|uniref:hypothetical protein n=1 Tax=Kitasatospora purpeofusca TaxID=67352 RepID=UPI003699DE33
MNGNGASGVRPPPAATVGGARPGFASRRPPGPRSTAARPLGQGHLELSAVFTQDPTASADQASTAPLRAWLHALRPALPELVAVHRADLEKGKRDTSARLVDGLSRHRDVPVPVAEFVGRLVVVLCRQPEPYTLPSTGEAAPERDLRQITATLTEGVAREAVVQPVTRDWLCGEGLRAVEHEFALGRYRAPQPAPVADSDDPPGRTDRQTRDLLRDGLVHLSQVVIPRDNQSAIDFDNPRKLVRYAMGGIQDVAENLCGVRQALTEYGIDPLDWLQNSCGLTPEAAAFMESAMAAVDEGADADEDEEE